MNIEIKNPTDISFWRYHTQNSMSKTIQKKEVIESDIEYRSYPRKFSNTIEISPLAGKSLFNDLPGTNKILFELPLCNDKNPNKVIYLNNICISEINEDQKNEYIKWSLVGFGQIFETIEQKTFNILKKIYNIENSEILPFALTSNDNYLPVVSGQEYFKQGMVIIAESKIDLSNIKIKVDVYNLIFNEILKDKYIDYLLAEKKELIDQKLRSYYYEPKTYFIHKLKGMTMFYFNKVSNIQTELLVESHFNKNLYLNFQTSHIIIYIGNYDITNVKLILNKYSVNVICEKILNYYVVHLTENKSLIKLEKYDGINFSAIEKLSIEFDVINYKHQQDVKIFSVHGQLMKVFGNGYGQMYSH